jgi:p-hydroxybenzoate 3-monooxygenase
VADVAVLAPALVAWLRDGDERPAAAYSDTALQRVWRAQDFSTFMTAMLHRHADEFENRRQRAALRTVVTSEAASRALAESYVGPPIPGR